MHAFMRQPIGLYGEIFTTSREVLSADGELWFFVVYSKTSPAVCLMACSKLQHIWVIVCGHNQQENIR